MDASDVAVATMTWPRSAEEELLLRRALESLSDVGMAVAVADRGTSRAFSDAIAQLPGFHLTIPCEPGLVAQVKASIALAGTFATRYILYVEPDKELFFKNWLRDFVQQASGEHNVGVVLASRSDQSFETFPHGQQYTERVANYLCGRRLGYSGDFLYGPFLMTRGLLPHVSNLETRLGWGWRLATFVAARRLGLEVVPVVGDYPCPIGQRTENDEDRAYRVRQLSENLLALVD